MEINTNPGVSSVNDPISFKRVAPVATGVDSAAFSQSVALSSGLKDVPETRPAAVSRARELISDVNYPPQETIRKISLLLAAQLDS